MKVLVAGGAGFIGSTIASACSDAGITPVVLDNLKTGRREFAVGHAFYEGGIEDDVLIDRIFDEHPDIFATVLCAALINVPDSVVDPVSYYTDNVAFSLRFVSSLVRRGCTRLIFSSSAAIYDVSSTMVVDETTALAPQSPYARTKAVCESMFADIAHATSLRVLSLRYFNPIGADPQMRSGLQLTRPTHALGQMILARESGVPFSVTGTDYDTRDGTGIRDYVHVWDLALAHVAALERFDALFTGDAAYDAINLGTGTGTTVRELLSAFEDVTSRRLDFVEVARRPGDVVGASAGNEKARRLLGWVPTRGLREGVADSLRWAQLRDTVLGE